MICPESYITRLSAWAPGLQNRAEWEQWAGGKREMQSGPESPAIAFTDPLFRRRLSQISKMTIQVVHDLLPVQDGTKIIFLSFRGEIARQYKINVMQIEEKSITPAAFSFSVFNAPPALAAMAFGLKSGYTALYPAGDSLHAGLNAANAALFSGAEEEIIFVYADEEVPAEYASLLSGTPTPFAFGLLLNRKKGSVPLSAFINDEATPLDFLKTILPCEGIHVSPLLAACF